MPTKQNELSVPEEMPDDFYAHVRLVNSLGITSSYYFSKLLRHGIKYAGWLFGVGPIKVGRRDLRPLSLIKAERTTKRHRQDVRRQPQEPTQEVSQEDWAP